MATIQVECPSGMAGTVRGLRVAEANKIAAATRRKRHEMIDTIMSDCWEKTAKPGPYNISGEDKPNWDEVLQGDAQYVLMQIRIATYGSEYSFSVQCTDAQCREKFEWVLDLNEVPIQTLSAASMERFIAGNAFESVIDGRRYTFALPTGKLAKKAAKMKAAHRDNKYSLALRLRITSIEGVEVNDLRRHIDTMGMGEVMELVAEFDEFDCGVDGDLEIECPECGGIMDITLPFEGDFFMPQKKRKRRNQTTAA